MPYRNLAIGCGLGSLTKVAPNFERKLASVLMHAASVIDGVGEEGVIRKAALEAYSRRLRERSTELFAKVPCDSDTCSVVTTREDMEEVIALLQSRLKELESTLANMKHGLDVEQLARSAGFRSLCREIGDMAADLETLELLLQTGRM